MEAPYSLRQRSAHHSYIFSLSTCFFIKRKCAHNLSFLKKEREKNVSKFFSVHQLICHFEDNIFFEEREKKKQRLYGDIMDTHAQGLTVNGMMTV